MLEKKQKQRSDIMVILFTKLLGVAFTTFSYYLAWGLCVRNSDWSMCIRELNYV